jgi:hypothetical protein
VDAGADGCCLPTVCGWSLVVWTASHVVVDDYISCFMLTSPSPAHSRRGGVCCVPLSARCTSLVPCQVRCSIHPRVRPNAVRVGPQQLVTTHTRQIIMSGSVCFLHCGSVGRAAPVCNDIMLPDGADPLRCGQSLRRCRLPCLLADARSGLHTLCVICCAVTARSRPPAQVAAQSFGCQCVSDRTGGYCLPVALQCTVRMAANFCPMPS